MAESLADYSVPEHHVLQFTSNVQAALNRMGGQFRMLVSNGAYQGEKSQVVNFLGPLRFTQRNTPYGDTEVSEVDHLQRWIDGTEYDCAVFVDRLDTLKMIYDPTSPYVERMREAAAREEDNIIVDRFFADARTGKQGATLTSFPAADTIAHGSTGLTVAKLRAVRKMAKQRHVNLRQTTPMLAATAEQMDDLLGETAVGSSDYNAVKPLVDGEVGRFMGIMFVPHEDYDGTGLPKNGNIRDCPFWVPDGMHYGTWQSITIVISPRPDKNNIKQIHGTFTSGATRLEEGKVLKVQCDES
jgi:hypothetical protein